MFRVLTALLLLCRFVPAQEVIVSDQPESRAFTKVLGWSGGALSYICTARSLQAVSTITVSTISNANPGSVSATAHGFYFNASGITAKPVVYISGATSGWVAINGTHVITPTSANAFNLDVDTTSFGSFSGQVITVTTKAPLITKSVWSVKSFVSDANGNPVFIAYAASSATSGQTNLSSGSTSGTTCAAPGAFQ